MQYLGTEPLKFCLLPQKNLVSKKTSLGELLHLPHAHLPFVIKNKNY